MINIRFCWYQIKHDFCFHIWCNCIYDIRCQRHSCIRLPLKYRKSTYVRCNLFFKHFECLCYFLYWVPIKGCADNFLIIHKWIQWIHVSLFCKRYGKTQYWSCAFAGVRFSESSRNWEKVGKWSLCCTVILLPVDLIWLGFSCQFGLSIAKC